MASTPAPSQLGGRRGRVWPLGRDREVHLHQDDGRLRDRHLAVTARSTCTGTRLSPGHLAVIAGSTYTLNFGGPTARRPLDRNGAAIWPQLPGPPGARTRRPPNGNSAAAARSTSTSHPPPGANVHLAVTPRSTCAVEGRRGRPRGQDRQVDFDLEPARGGKRPLGRDREVHLNLGPRPAARGNVEGPPDRNPRQGLFGGGTRRAGGLPARRGQVSRGGAPGGAGRPRRRPGNDAGNRASAGAD